MNFMQISSKSDCMVPSYVQSTKKTGGRHREKQGKIKKNTFLFVFLRFFYVFPGFFLVFCRMFHKGRISKNTLQISLTPPKNPSLVDFLCVDPR